MWVNIQRITGMAHCANVVWPDLEYNALSLLPVSKDILGDRPKRGRKDLDFAGSQPCFSDTLFDSSQAQRLQNQSVYAEAVCRLRLYR
jgi:hypothetical protein